MAHYGKPEYWEDRYTKDPDPFDWYQRWAQLKDVLTQYIQPTQQILNLGSGNSRMSEEMYDEGFQFITNVDISNVVIHQMQDKYKEKCPNMKYLVMDVRSLQFEEGSFDSVIDKGTLDSILCGDSSGPNAEAMLSEIHRILSPNGVYICISYGIPAQREHYFKHTSFHWDLTTHKVAKPTINTATVLAADDKEKKNFHYIYVLKKHDQKAAAEPAQ